MLPHKLFPKYTPSCDVRDNDSKAKAKSAESYNMRKGVKTLPELKDNQAVRVRLPAEKQWGEAEKIIARRGETSYFIRNRLHLQAIPELILVTAEANCGVTGGSGERPSDAGGDVAQGSSLPDPVTTRASTDCYVTRSGSPSIPVRKYQAGV